MTDRDERQQHVEALGEPPGATAPEPDQGDLAGEHDETSVSADVITGADEGEREPEAARGWAGEDHGTTPT